MQPQEKQKFKKGSICIRCGMDKSEIKKTGHSCKVWGTYYEKHIYNTKEVEISVINNMPNQEKIAYIRSKASFINY